MMNNINYLSISKTPYKLSYATFKGRVLTSYGEYNLDYLNHELETYDRITHLIKTHNIDIVLSNLIDYEKQPKIEIQKLSEFQTIIKLSALKNNALYTEFRTYGWEKRLLFSRVTARQKVETVNFGYDIDLKYNQAGIANAIILGEGVAHNRLQIGSV